MQIEINIPDNLAARLDKICKSNNETPNQFVGHLVNGYLFSEEYAHLADLDWDKEIEKGLESAKRGDLYTPEELKLHIEERRRKFIEAQQ